MDGDGTIVGGSGGGRIRNRNTNMQRLFNDVNEVKGILTQDVAKARERGKKVDDLSDIAGGKRVGGSGGASQNSNTNTQRLFSDVSEVKTILTQDVEKARERDVALKGRNAGIQRLLDGVQEINDVFKEFKEIAAGLDEKVNRPVDLQIAPTQNVERDDLRKPRETTTPRRSSKRMRCAIL